MEKSFKWIGIDESGKGDFFGHLIVAGVVVDKEKLEILNKMNVRDSKKISDNRIIYLAKIIKQNFLSSVVSISPKKFNELYEKFKNINKILAWSHSRVLKNLLQLEDVDKVIIDKFTTKNYIETFLTKEEKNINKLEIIKGENDIAVASASILARANFLISLKKLSEIWNFNLPKGASKIVDESGVEFIKKYGIENLKLVSKVNFRNFKRIYETIKLEENKDV